MAELNVVDTFSQLSDFADNLQHQLQRAAVEPLREYQASIGVAIKAARTFDDESEALDAAHHKYLSLSRDSPVETRAYAHGELCDRAAGVNLSLFDARSALREGCTAEHFVPQRALSELLVAQLAYHQSCSRLLTSIMPQVSRGATLGCGSDVPPCQPGPADSPPRATTPHAPTCTMHPVATSELLQARTHPSLRARPPSRLPCLWARPPSRLPCRWALCSYGQRRAKRRLRRPALPTSCNVK